MRIRNEWFGVPRPVADPALRLFAFPFAGGGASVYRSWPDMLPPGVELWAVQLPGREGRFREPAYTSLEDLIPPLAAALTPHIDRPFAFFGHSMGALIAFSLVRELRRRSLPEPELLIVSGHRAPHRPDPDPPIHALPHDDFIAKIREFDGTPEAILENEELLELLLPILRSDFTLCETYEYAPEPPLRCELVALGGLTDPDVTEDEVNAWAESTIARCTTQMFPGGHFYLLDEKNAIPEEVSRYLRLHQLDG